MTDAKLTSDFSTAQAILGHLVNPAVHWLCYGPGESVGPQLLKKDGMG
jgi:hypothetical protein